MCVIADWTLVSMATRARRSTALHPCSSQPIIQPANSLRFDWSAVTRQTNSISTRLYHMFYSCQCRYCTHHELSILCTCTVLACSHAHKSLSYRMIVVKIFVLYLERVQCTIHQCNMLLVYNYTSSRLYSFYIIIIHVSHRTHTCILYDC